MSKVKPWVKPLNVSINDYEKWSSEVSSDESVTFWALSKGKLRSDKYLYWAREHYQLPVLKDAYFAEHFNQTLWQQIHSVANWSPQLFPVDEWDGLIYLACVEPPSDANWSFPVAYVLANARAMKTHWKKLNDTKFIPKESELQEKDELPLSGESEQNDDVVVTSLSQVSSEELIVPPTLESLDVPDFEMTDVGEDHIASIQIPTVEDESAILGEFVQQSENHDPVIACSETDTPIVNEVVSGGESADGSQDTSTKEPQDFSLEIPPVPDATEFSLEEAPQEIETPDGMSFDISVESNDEPPSPEGVSLHLPPAEADVSAPEGMQFEASIGDETSSEDICTDDPLLKDEFTLSPPKTLTSMNVLSHMDNPETDLPPEIPSDISLASIGETTPSDDTTQASKATLINSDEPSATADAKGANEFKLKFNMSEGHPDETPPDPAHLTNTTQTNSATVTRFAIATTGVNKEAPSGAVVDTEKSAPHTSDSCSSESEVAAWLFCELRNHFHQSMILLYNGKELKPWKWENNWSPKSTQAFDGFNPDQPGLFRIIKRTKQPYHGYIVNSSLNKDFFNLWGFDSFPEHVTAMPLVIDGHLSGIVLCLGDESSNTDRVLLDTEKIIDEFLTALVRITSKAA